jgi:hypothetical protein
MPSEVPMIDEQSRRWPDFQGGRAIVLPDGQAWVFFEPEATLRAGRPGWTFGPGVPRDVDAILSGRFARLVARWTPDGDHVDRGAIILTAGWFLLARNYAITAEEFGRIMAGLAGWPEAEQRDVGEQILSVVGTACARATALAEVA